MPSSGLQLYVVFLHGSFCDCCICLPSCTSKRNLNHCKLLLSVPCKGPNCLDCVLSQRENARESSYKGQGHPHFISYYATINRPWSRIVDQKELTNQPYMYTYIQVPLRYPDRVQEILDATVGKSMNRKGLLFNFYLGCKFGVTLNTYTEEVFKSQPSWMCTELAICVLIDQGYTSYLTENEICQTTPLQLWRQMKKIPHSSLLQHHPSTPQQPLDQNMDFPTGGGGGG